MRLRSSLYRPATVVFAALLLSTACGGGGGIETADAPSTTRPDAGGNAELCEQLESSDGPSEELAASLPEDHARAAKAIMAFSASMDAMGDDEEADAEQLMGPLLEDGVAADLADFAAYAEDECGESEATAAIAGLSDAAAIATEDRDDDYCDALSEAFASEGEGPAQVAALADVAPESHREALGLLEAMAGDPDAPGSDELFGPLFGLGGYAELRCGVEGGLMQMMIGAMFAGMGDGGSGATTTTIDPSSVSPADATAATAALPTGSGIEFEVASVDLDDGYTASVVVPVGWESDSIIGLAYSPPSGSSFSIFSEIVFDAGCDGVCEATGWDARLRAPDGYLTSYLEAHPGATEAPVSGSEGIVVTATDGPSAIVLRWDDGADKYFKCEVDLDEDDAALFPALLAACEAARPAWFAVGSAR